MNVRVLGEYSPFWYSDTVGHMSQLLVFFPHVPIKHGP